MQDWEVLRLGGRGRSARARRAALGLVVQAGTRPWLDHRMPLAVRRRALGLSGRISAPIPRDVEVAQVDLGGVPTWQLTPPNAAAGRHLFVLHGGGYNYGGLGTHGGAYTWLARLMGVTAWMPDYRVVPEHPSTAPLEDAVRAWAALAERHPGEVCAVTGDSAGGGLALGLACEARDLGLPVPACLLLHSPWVDADPALAARRPRDRLLHPRFMGRDAEVWVGSGDPRDPVLSPIHRDLAGLPPTFVQWGEHEALHLDAEVLVSALRAAEVDVRGEAYADLWHVAFLHVPALTEAKAWQRRTAAFALGHFGDATPVAARP